MKESFRWLGAARWFSAALTALAVIVVSLVLPSCSARKETEHHEPDASRLAALRSALESGDIVVFAKDEAAHESNNVKPRIYVRNDGTEAFSDFAVLVFFSVENGKVPVLEDFWTPSSVPSLTSLDSNGNYQIRYDFTGQTLDPGEVLPSTDGNVVSLHFADWSPWDRSNDHSLNGLGSTFAETDQIVVVDANGNIVAGSPPGGAPGDDTADDDTTDDDVSDDTAGDDDTIGDDTAGDTADDDTTGDDDTADDDTSDDDDPDPGPGTTHTFFITMPKGVSRQELTFSVTGGPLRLNDRVEVFGPGPEGFGNVSALVGGSLHRLGVDGRVGRVWSDGPVELANFARASGELMTSEHLVTQAGATVGGLITENADLSDFEVRSWEVFFPEVTGPLIDLQPASELELQPGAHPSISVKTDAVLGLHPGVYTIENLTVEFGGELRFNNDLGPILLYIKNQFTYRGEQSRRDSDTPNVFFGVASSDTVVISAPWHGTLVAPYARVAFVNTLQGHRGSFFARDIEAHQSTQYFHEPFEPGLLCQEDSECDGFCPCDPGEQCSEDSQCQEGFECNLGGICACTPNCADKACGDTSSDGCGGVCTGLCDEGETGCTTDVECGNGLACIINGGPQRGHPPGTNVCLPSECRDMNPALPNCGVGDADCGPCPACVPDCSGKLCGDDGCGGECGATPDGVICGPLGSVDDPFDPMMGHTPAFPEPLPPQDPQDGDAAGTLPGAFQVTSRGTASYSIPLTVAPGRQGLQPGLSLEYESTKRNGMLGVGWSIGGFSVIKRCPRTVAQDGKAAPVLLNHSDALCLDGKRLFRGEETSPLNFRYYTELEEFSRIRSFGDHFDAATGRYAGPEGFTVETKAGLTLTYGKTTIVNSPVPGATQEITDSIVRGLDVIRTVWGLSRVEDRAGNFMIVRYTGLNSFPREAETELLPQLIAYGGQGNTYSADRSVTFHYENRPDPRHHYFSGTVGFSNKRLERIDVRVESKTSQSYELEYIDGSENFGDSRLASVRQCGFSGGVKRCLPRTRFSYNSASSFGENTTRMVPEPADQLFVQRFALDLNGDGRDDVVYGKHSLVAPTVWRAELNRFAEAGEEPDDAFELLPSLHSASIPSGSTGLVTDFNGSGRLGLMLPRGTVFWNGSGLAAGELGGQVSTGGVDYDGDGLTDLFVRERVTAGRNVNGDGTSNIGILFSNPDGTTERVLWPHREIRDDRLLSIDLDGDGAHDLIDLNSGRRLIKNGRDLVEFDPDATLPRSRAWNVTLSRLKLMDVNGDGLTDLLHPGIVDWPDGVRTVRQKPVLFMNTGFNRFEKQNPFRDLSEFEQEAWTSQFNFGELTSSGDPVPPEQRTSPHFRNMVVYDYDGDGRDDLLDPLSGSVLRSTGTGKFEIHAAFMRIVGSLLTPDLDGNGDPDLLFGPTRSWTLGNSIRGGLLRRIEDGLGKVIEVDYLHEQVHPESSEVVPIYQRLRAECPSQGPECGPAAGTRYLNRVAPLVANYRVYRADDAEETGPRFRFFYEQGVAGLEGRGWQGFHAITQYTLDNNDNLFSKTRTTYGTDEYWKVGLPEKIVTTFEPFDTGAVYSEPVRRIVTAENRWLLEQTPASIRPFVWLDQQRVFTEEQVEGAERQTVVANTINRAHDDFGNLTLRDERIGLQQREVRIQETTYSNDTVAWRVGLPIQTTSRSFRGALSSEVSTGFVYDDRGQPIRVTRQPGEDSDPSQYLETHFIRNPITSNVERVEHRHLLGSPREMLITYDSRDFFPIFYTDRHGDSVEVQFDDRFGVLLTTMDPNGVVIQSAYDEWGRIDTRRFPTHEEYTAYSPSSPMSGDFDSVLSALRIDQTIPGDGTTNTWLDSFGQVVKESTSGWFGTDVVQEYDYDWAGRLTIASLPHAAGDISQGRTAYNYDDWGRLLSVIAPGMAPVSYEYLTPASADPRAAALFDDEWGRQATLIETADGALEFTVTDHLGLPVRVTQVDTNVQGTSPAFPLSGGGVATSRYEYESFGRLVNTTDPDGEHTVFTNDVLGRRVRFENPTLGTVHTTYNAFSDVIRERSATGRLLCYEYDDLGRIAQQRESLDTSDCTSAPVIQSWTYDGPNGTDVGRLVQVARVATPESSAPVLLRYGYDPVTGQLASIEQTVSALDAPLVTELSYDGPRLDVVRYPAPVGTPFELKHTYDNDGNLVELSDNLDPGAAPFWRLDSAEQGIRIGAETLGNNLQTRYTYHNDTSPFAECDEPGVSCLPGTVRSQSTFEGATSGTPPIRAFEYRYDHLLNVQRKLTSANAQLINVEQYDYDALGRLTDFQASTPTGSSSRQYFYTAAGNLSTVNILDPTGALTTEHYTYDINRPHLATRRDDHQYFYDAAGNQTIRVAFDGTTDIREYNDFNMPWRISSSDGTETTLQYDGNLNRAVKRGPQRTTIYAQGLYECEGATLQGETTPITCDQHRYNVNLGGRLIAQIQRDQTGQETDRFYVIGDHLGSTNFITDQTGTITETRQFAPFGESMNAFVQSSLTQGFTGHEHDTELGLINMRGRLYDPALRRFITPDPFVFEPFNPQGINRYSYVQNNPINFTDPSGFEVDRSGIPVSPPVKGELRIDESQTILGFSCSGSCTLSDSQINGSSNGSTGGNVVLGPDVITGSTGGAVEQGAPQGVPASPVGPDPGLAGRFGSGESVASPTLQNPGTVPVLTGNGESAAPGGIRGSRVPSIPRAPNGGNTVGTGPGIAGPAGVGRVVQLGIQAIKKGGRFGQKAGRVTARGAKLPIDDLVAAVKNGEDVIVDSREIAKEIARKAGTGEPILHSVAREHARQGFRPHFHPRGVPGSPHVFFSTPAITFSELVDEVTRDAARTLQFIIEELLLIPQDTGMTPPIARPANAAP